MGVATSPTISPVPGISYANIARYGKLYNNPHFDYLSEMLPKNIKELFKWCEVVYSNMPAIANAIRKLINYPVTEFSVSDASDDIRKSTLKFLDTINMRQHLLEFGNDIYVYGNAFRTVYIPFRRYLKCKRCQQETAIDAAKFKIEKKEIILTCSCGFKGASEIIDRDTNDLEGIKIVKWDPKQIELKQNPITGSTVYYYSIPKNIVTDIKKGELSILKDTPKVFVEAALQGKNIQMGSNFYHGKVATLSGYSSGWGISPLMPTLKNYMYIAVLRRAAEAIGMEHITPKTILFPQSSGTSDPSIMSSMSKWRKEITSALERWRWDPNYIMTAPYPTGITNIGSQGKALTTIEEIKDARVEMGLALDIPPGLIMGDMNIQNSAVGLRILENQLTPQVNQLETFIKWVINRVNVAFKKNFAFPTLIPFRIADDIMNKQLLIQMLGNGVSKSTVQEALNLVPGEEEDRLKKEQIDAAKMQQDVQAEITKLQTNAMAQAQAVEQEAVTGKPSQYNQQKMIAEAQQMAQEAMQYPYEQRRSYMAQLQNEDYVMWALVRAQLESLHAQQGQQQQQQQQQG